MKILINLVDASVLLDDADDIEVVLYMDSQREITFKKSEGGVKGRPDSFYEIKHDTGPWKTGMLYCKFRTLKDGQFSEWYSRQIGFLQ